MAITGIRRLTYLVDNVEGCTRFFDDFGLKIEEQGDEAARLSAANGADIRLLMRGHADLPQDTQQTGIGVYECVWSVDSEESLAGLCDDLSRDHQLTTDAEGIVHFVTPFGQAIGLQVWASRPVYGAPSPSNTPGFIGRLNQGRKWIDRALPKRIHHVVWTFPDVDEALDYYRSRLNFRLTDIQKGFGVYIRADGAFEHHNVFIANAHAGMPGFDGTLKFHHSNFEVEDIDEIMVAKNFMDRRGHETGEWGLGRHRQTSAAFMYFPCPAGGEAEYGADCDCLDDSWRPRIWGGAFATAIFMHNLPHWMQADPDWDVRFARPDEHHYMPAD